MKNVSDGLMPSEVSCDVCCLVYDASNPRSFEFVARIFLVRYLINLFASIYSLIQSPDPKSRPVVITIFPHVVRKSVR